jgi:hypothetical protein
VGNDSVLVDRDASTVYANPDGKPFKVGGAEFFPGSNSAFVARGISFYLSGAVKSFFARNGGVLGSDPTVVLTVGNQKVRFFADRFALFTFFENGQLESATLAESKVFVNVKSRNTTCPADHFVKFDSMGRIVECRDDNHWRSRGDI